MVGDNGSINLVPLRMQLFGPCTVLAVQMFKEGDSAMIVFSTDTFVRVKAYTSAVPDSLKVWDLVTFDVGFTQVGGLRADNLRVVSSKSGSVGERG